MAEEGSFFSRWSKRKADVTQGKPVVDPPPVSAVPSRTATPVTPPVQVNEALPVAPDQKAPDQQPPERPPLTLDDVKALTPESDFSAFAARDVSPDVRNAAMKKLFTDPHYNVMDRMDIYIDDYSKSDPIPESMLRQMVGAQFLNLFESDVTAEVADDKNSSNLSTQHAHADMRLQPDHAACGTENAGNPQPGLERTAEPAQRPLPP